MNTIPDLAILMIETKRDRDVIPGVLEDIRVSLFSQEPRFIIVSGEGSAECLSVALNRGIRAAIQNECRYIFWAHPDMRFEQPNWHIPLMKILDEKKSVMKVCSANSRDKIIPGLRLGHEQSWMMRTSDYVENPWLWFDEDFAGIGGYEDLYQSYQIISRGRLVLIDSSSLVYHKGMGTRSQMDTRKEQIMNHDRYLKLVGNTEDPHQWSNFCSRWMGPGFQRDLSMAGGLLIHDFPQWGDLVNNGTTHKL